MHKGMFHGLLGLTVAVAGCTVGADQGAPNVATDGVGEAYYYDGWTATSYAPILTYPPAGCLIRAKAVFSGTGTKKAGVCLVKKHLPAQACSSVNDCGSAPASLPPGGYRYCAAPGGSGQKYCFFRQGSPTNYCAGSPAQGGAPVAAGTYLTPNRSALLDEVYASLACFEGCASSDPFVSSVTLAVGGCTAGS